MKGCGLLVPKCCLGKLLCSEHKYICILFSTWNALCRWQDPEGQGDLRHLTSSWRQAEAKVICDVWGPHPSLLLGHQTNLSLRLGLLGLCVFIAHVEKRSFGVGGGQGNTNSEGTRWPAPQAWGGRGVSGNRCSHPRSLMFLRGSDSASFRVARHHLQDHHVHLASENLRGGFAPGRIKLNNFDAV